MARRQPIDSLHSLTYFPPYHHLAEITDQHHHSCIMCVLVTQIRSSYLRHKHLTHYLPSTYIIFYTVLFSIFDYKNKFISGIHIWYKCIHTYIYSIYCYIYTYIAVYILYKYKYNSIYTICIHIYEIKLFLVKYWYISYIYIHI